MCVCVCAGEVEGMGSHRADYKVITHLPLLSAATSTLIEINHTPERGEKHERKERREEDGKRSEWKEGGGGFCFCPSDKESGSNTAAKQRSAIKHVKCSYHFNVSYGSDGVVRERGREE